ncbi:hypothetical protein DCAR_0102284 [Daucus carota subsp. sativus]|uniref:RRM domain-containing protein n=1 Tax=Daucus carota subsp. sativus TaxID=79200 RepID=A0A166H027_DAUCS|nr:hypothetical protein DCAR_0102284 [Daucus carota subsp. sativus]
MGRGKVGDSRGDTQAKKAKSSFGEDRWISLARRARQGRDPLAEEEIVDLQNCIMKFWFLLDSDLLGVITKGDLRWADVAMARIDYLEAHIDQVLLGKCLEGDEESLCELHRMLMNEGWWDRAENLDLRKTVWRRDESWDEMVGLQERELKEYILSRSELVHPNVISMVRKEDREGIRMALNHIHYNSIRESRSVKQMKAMVKEGKELKTGNHDSKAVEGEGINYKSALLKTRGSMSERPIEVPKEHKKVVRPQLGINVENERKNSTVFLHNLPEDLNRMVMWRFVRQWGRVIDCFTPNRKDRLGKRFGFAKLQSMQEAELFKNKINGKILAGNVIRAQFARGKKVSNLKQKKGNYDKEYKEPSHELNNRQTESKDPRQPSEDALVERKEKPLRLEAVNKELVNDLGRSVVVQTWKDSSVVEVLNTAEVLGYQGVLVRGLSSRKFLITFPTMESFLNMDQELFGLGYLGCHQARLDDLVLPRKVVVQCLGLPAVLWELSNLTKLLMGIGDITAIGEMLDEELRFQNPLIELETKETTRINRQILVEYDDLAFQMQILEVENAMIQVNVLEELRKEELVEDMMEGGDVTKDKDNETSKEGDGSAHGNSDNALEFGDCASDDYLVGNVENEREESEHEMEDAEGSVEIVYETPVNAVEVTGKKQSLSRESSIQDCQKEMCNSHGLTNSSKEVLTCYEDQITSKEGVLSNCREIIVKETRAEEDVQLDDCMGGDHIRNSNANGEIYNKEIVVASAQAGDQTQLSDCSIDDRIWHTRDDDLSSVSSKLGQTLSWEDSNVSSREFEDEPRSDESVRIMEGKMIRMNLGRKRGRPAKRKTNKVNLPFALKNKEQPVANITGKSEAEKIYETCLLMGLEGQVNRDEAIRKIADRLSVR